MDSEPTHALYYLDHCMVTEARKGKGKETHAGDDATSQPLHIVCYVKASIPYDWVAHAVRCIEKSAFDSTNCDDTTVRTRIVTQKGLFEMMNQQQTHVTIPPPPPSTLVHGGYSHIFTTVVDKHNLDRFVDSRVYFAQVEIDRLMALIYAGLFLEKPMTRHSAIQVVVAILVAFFAALRISGMVGSHDRGRALLRVLLHSLPYTLRWVGTDAKSLADRTLGYVVVSN